MYASIYATMSEPLYFVSLAACSLPTGPRVSVFGFPTLPPEG